MLRFELPCFFEEAPYLIKIKEGLLEDLRDVVLPAREFRNRLQELLLDHVLLRLALITPKGKLALACVVKDLVVLALPALKKTLLGGGLTVHLDKSQQLAHEPVAGELECGHRAFETLQKLRADE